MGSGASSSKEISPAPILSKAAAKAAAKAAKDFTPAVSGGRPEALTGFQKIAHDRALLRAECDRHVQQVIWEMQMPERQKTPKTGCPLRSIQEMPRAGNYW
eukprot:TRINITY_DN18701_c0_g1_i1.p1 TRINITY_DN18701_c0_g1~~TRINITY_DN18701_c0_g1_i1.p1  ORF type:complete len:101 (+),score=33.35 TRINITY_DN18701_c0_g1_i1:211-513(+)